MGRVGDGQSHQYVGRVWQIPREFVESACLWCPTIASRAECVRCCTRNIVQDIYVRAEASGSRRLRGTGPQGRRPIDGAQNIAAKKPERGAKERRICMQYYCQRSESLQLSKPPN